MPVAEALDRACAEAVELARAAAIGRAGAMGVGEHLGVIVEDVRVATHLFACPHPGYPGWSWQVTVARASRARVVTVSEVTLLPGPDSLLAPTWVPWSDRVGPGDLSPGVIMPTPDNDPRVEPGFTAADMPPDMEPAEWSATRAVVAELGLGRERVLSAEGRDDAAERWLAGDGGPDNPMTTQAPGVCETCAYFVALSGPLGRVFGACANEYTPSDGRVVSRDHGCGAHSDATEVSRGEQLRQPAWDTVSLDTSIF
ncbi:MAG: DUF3027 domain-containing protein [Propionibacterium sp.]|nr:DUF3027 domain-containing protein [Propionibacterium sp.]HMQ37969.1 DUF3027 domain-containing protein [Micropruina sp.]